MYNNYKGNIFKKKFFLDFPLHKVGRGSFKSLENWNSFFLKFIFTLYILIQISLLGEKNNPKKIFATGALMLPCHNAVNILI